MNEIQQRAGLYQLFSSIFLREVDHSLLLLLKEPQWKTQLSSIGVDVPAATDEVIEELAVDFCRIFIGPKDHAPPIQSVWSEDQLQGTPVESMKYFMSIAPPKNRGPIEDHLGIQLEMMGLILVAQTEFPDDADSLAQAFFVRHIAWSTLMLQGAQAIAQTDFYRQIIRATGKFVDQERSEFQTVGSGSAVQDSPFQK